MCCFKVARAASVLDFHCAQDAGSLSTHRDWESNMSLSRLTGIFPVKGIICAPRFVSIHLNGVPSEPGLHSCAVEALMQTKYIFTLRDSKNWLTKT